MKIWALEKLQRMMTTMFNGDTGSQVQHGHNTRSNPVQTSMPRTARGADLSQLLRNERINGPSDRDPTVASKEMTIFKGPFIYIHDIDEKQRPIMVREYAKVSRKEDGDWPQFRSVANGKCPFVEEIDYGRRDAEREMIRQQRQQEKERAAAAPRARAAAAAAAGEAPRMHPSRAVNGKRSLSEMEGAHRNINPVATVQAHPFDQTMTVPVKDEQTSAPANAFISRAAPGRQFGGEPVASGVQPSNITSAIRSQMISSTAAAPGAKAGTSKEVHGLQRKVLEKNSGPASHGGLTSSHRMTDIATTVREDTSMRLAKKKTQEKLNHIDEDAEHEETVRKAEVVRKTKAAQKMKLGKDDPKPGYCENCQDKFDDFEEVYTYHSGLDQMAKANQLSSILSLVNTANLLKSPKIGQSLIPSSPSLPVPSANTAESQRVSSCQGHV
jgi:regulatory subunit for Cdc7p protein kinase